MKTPEPEIEALLRAAPQPAPPPGLRERLVSAVRLPAGRSAAAPRRTLGAQGWFAQWWPVLTTACLALACAVVVAVQQIELGAESQRIAEASELGPAAATDTSASPAGGVPEANTEVGDAPDEHAETAQLRAQATQLRQEIATLENLGQENQKLRADLAAQTNAAPEFAELAEASAHAQSIQCINNLKQVGLAARIWAVDHGDKLPPDFAAMSNELSNPKILVCPGDKAHVVASGFDSLTAANITYEYLAANGSEDEPSRVAFRCPVHGHVGLCDGSVQSEVAKKRPASLVARDGKLYLE